MTEPTALARRAVVDLDKLVEDLHPQPKLVPIQPEHSADNLDNLGKMSADAVRAQYEAAAKAFEVMGEEVKDRIDKLEASLDEAAASMKLLSEAAAAIREQGKLAHMQIAEMSSVTKNINTMCAEVMKKVAGK
jgi:hypothetical protein